MNSEQDPIQFDDELIYSKQQNQSNDNSSLDSIDEIGQIHEYETERQASIEKLVNDVLIPPLSDSNADNASRNDGNNLHSESPPLVSDIDLSNISPLSSLQAHGAANNHPYFSNLDNHHGAAQDGKVVQTQANPNDTSTPLGKIKPINIASSNQSKARIHYSNTPNILSSEYANEYGQKSFHGSMVKDDLYYLEYGNRINGGQRAADYRMNGSLNLTAFSKTGVSEAGTNTEATSSSQARSKYLHSLNVNNLNLNLSGGPNAHSPHNHQLTSPHQLSGGGVAGHIQGGSGHGHPHHAHSHHVSPPRSHHNTPNPHSAHSSHSSSQQSPNTTQTSPLTPHSVRTAHTALHSPHSAHSSHTPHTPHSMNHAFPRFTPYSTQQHPHSTAPSYSWQGGPKSAASSTATPATTTSTTTATAVSAVSPATGSSLDKSQDIGPDMEPRKVDPVDAVGDMPQTAVMDEQNERKMALSLDQGQLDPDDHPEEELVAPGTGADELKVIAPDSGVNGANGNGPKLSPQAMFKSLSRSKSGSIGHSPRSTSSFITSGPRLNYDEEGLSPQDVQEVLSQLDIRPDTLRDSSTDFRPVFSCIRPIVCHKSNTPFYAQCSTAKLGYCTWCRQLRRGNQKQGSICLNCGERLTAKYHRWYPHLVRLEPLEKTRTKSMYKRYKPVFERFGITWHNEKQFDFVVDHYMLMKIYLSTENFNIEPLHLERTYMIGVFAGREFNTGALARKLLREGSKLAMFRADFPEYYDFLRDERAAVAEQMNLRFFQGVYKCYFHAHYTNIEGWYDPSVISRESIIETFKELCNTILAHTALAHINQNNNGSQQQSNNQQSDKQVAMGSMGGGGRGGNNNRKYSKKSGGNKRGNHNHHNHKMNGGNNHNHNHRMNNNNNSSMLQQRLQQQQQQQSQQQQQQQQQQQNLLKLANANQQLQQQQTPVMNMNMIQNGMINQGVAANVFHPNMMNLNAINQMNGIQINGAANVPHMNLVNSVNSNQPHQQQQQQQQQQPQRANPQSNDMDNNTNNQLLAATQSMLNGIASSMPPPPSMLNQLSVTNMAAITPIAKVKTFQFNTPTTSTPQTLIRTNSQNQISPQYLPPLATTPRFTVPTPRGTPSTQTYTAINLNNMNSITNPLSMNTSSPLQANGSNPSSVSMLAANGSLQIPSSMLKNTSVGGMNKMNLSKSKEAKSDPKGKDAKNGKKDKKGKDGKAQQQHQHQHQQQKQKNEAKNALNAGAPPFLLNTGGVISPPISPRNFNRNRFVPPPPHPQSFAFPPQTTNWLPVPPVLSATTPTNAQSLPSSVINGSMGSINNIQLSHGQQPPQHQNNSNSMNAMNMSSLNGLSNTLSQKAMNSNVGDNPFNNNEVPVNLSQNKGSPLFTPTQSPQFHPFSH